MSICSGPTWTVEPEELPRQSPRAHRLRRPFRVGDGAHFTFNGDSYPCTVRRVSKTGHRITVTKDRTRAPGIFEPLTDAEVERAEADHRRVARVFTRRRDGSYRNGTGGMWLLCHGRLIEWNREL